MKSFHDTITYQKRQCGDDNIMHIAITGKLGSGKSTAAANLSQILGYEIYSTGSIQRHAAAEMGITTLELNQRMMNDPSLDHVIDDTVTAISKERDHIIFDSRMAWHFAHNAYRVFITVDDAEAARRVFAAERGDVESYRTVEEAEASLKERSELERQRFISIYGVDYNSPDNYDLVVDSTDMQPGEVAEIIAREFRRVAE